MVKKEGKVILFLVVVSLLAIVQSRSAFPAIKPGCYGWFNGTKNRCDNNVYLSGCNTCDEVLYEGDQDAAPDTCIPGTLDCYLNSFLQGNIETSLCVECRSSFMHSDPVQCHCSGKTCWLFCTDGLTPCRTDLDCIRENDVCARYDGKSWGECLEKVEESCGGSRYEGSIIKNKANIIISQCIVTGNVELSRGRLVIWNSKIKGTIETNNAKVKLYNSRVQDNTVFSIDSPVPYYWIGDSDIRFKQNEFKGNVTINGGIFSASDNTFKGDLTLCADKVDTSRNIVYGNIYDCSQTHETGATCEMTIYYKDEDGDGYGNSSSTTTGCSMPERYIDNALDCNDADGSVHPGGIEVKCDGIDQDCSGSDDEGIDNDNDGYKIDGGYCGIVDCNDMNKYINPAANENCDNNRDDDCDRLIDNLDPDCFACTPGTTKPCPVQDGACKGAMQTCTPEGQWPGCYDTTYASHNQDFERIETSCDGIDNNCNNETDEGLKTTFFLDSDEDGFGDPLISKFACSKPANFTLDNTDCDDTNGNINPAAKEVCDMDGVDENCNRDNYEECGCRPNHESQCGPPTDDGECAFGTRICDSTGNWGECTGAVYKESELCDGLDNDCDKLIDEDFTQKGTPCYKGVGACKAQGIYVCSESQYSVECNAQPSSSNQEICDNIDNDCDGYIDEAEGNMQNYSIKVSCYSGDPKTLGKGLCKSGQRNCVAGSLSNACIGEITPTREICDGADNDCDDVPDNGCLCINGQNQSCYTGSSETEGIGECRAGIQFCLDGKWGECQDEITPIDEQCNGRDDDCDNSVDEVEDLAIPSCAKDVGACRGSYKICGGKQGWLDCNATNYGPLYQTEETSCDKEDNDCDDDTDEGCSCVSGTTSTCGTDIGECDYGIKTCINGNWSACTGGVKGTTEICDGLDNNCNQQVDEGFDDDHDGIADCFDNCPDFPSDILSDKDNDGVGDVCDNCPDIPGTDSDDNDGICGKDDNCPTKHNPDQSDCDNDGIGDACDTDSPCSQDMDRDGVVNSRDNCWKDANPLQGDKDGDGIGDVCDECAADAANDFDQDGFCKGEDNCPSKTNADQKDSDNDGWGDVCDPCRFDSLNDADGDYRCGDIDNCPFKANEKQQDCDNDGIGDACDTDSYCSTDSDYDGIPDYEDNCAEDKNHGQEDSDNDGIGDMCDTCPYDAYNDLDQDELCGNDDNCPKIFNPKQLNVDEDLFGDACDLCPMDPNNDIDGDSICGDKDNCPELYNPQQEPCEQVAERESTKGDIIKTEVNEEDITNFINQSGYIRSNNATPKELLTQYKQLKSVMKLQQEVFQKDGKTFTRYTLIVTPQENLTNFTYLQNLPKCLVQHSDNIMFQGKNYNIRESDPLIAWHFLDLNLETVISYDVEGKIDDQCLSQLKEFAVTDTSLHATSSKKNFFSLFLLIISSGIITYYLISKKGDAFEKNLSLQEYSDIGRKRFIKKKVKQIKSIHGKIDKDMLKKELQIEGLDEDMIAEILSKT